VNWAYIAGFFDGEGSVVSMMNYALSPSIEMSQSKVVGKLLLEDIQKFLKENGIESSVRERLTSPSHLGKQPVYNLRLRSVEGVQKFILSTLPYLRIKRAVAQDVMRFRKLYPPRYRGYRERNPNGTFSDERKRR